MELSKHLSNLRDFTESSQIPRAEELPFKAGPQREWSVVDDVKYHLFFALYSRGLVFGTR